MSGSGDWILGEYRRVLDDRFRLSLPAELAGEMFAEGNACVLVKERPGCLSLWNEPTWRSQFDPGIDLVRAKIRAGKLEGRLHQVQLLGRMLSTRHRPVELAQRGRLLIPEGFREFLRVEPGGEVLVVGAAVCVELWRPEAWFAYLEKRLPRFQRLFQSLSS